MKQLLILLLLTTILACNTPSEKPTPKAPTNPKIVQQALQAYLFQDDEEWKQYISENLTDNKAQFIACAENIKSSSQNWKPNLTTCAALNKEWLKTTCTELSPSDVSEVLDELIRDVKGVKLVTDNKDPSGWMFTIALEEFFKLSDQEQKNANRIFLDILKPILTCE